jgi:hypothetical protein
MLAAFIESDSAFRKARRILDAAPKRQWQRSCQIKAK